MPSGAPPPPAEVFRCRRMAVVGGLAQGVPMWSAAAPSAGPLRIVISGRRKLAVLQPRVNAYIVLKLGEGQAWPTGRASPGLEACVRHTGNHRGGTMEDRDMRALRRRRPPTATARGAFTGGRSPCWPSRSRSGCSWCATAAATDFAAPTDKLYDGHKLLGLVILLLALARLVYRLCTALPRRAHARAVGEAGQPPHPLGDLRAAHPRAADRLARHLLLRPVRAFGIKLPALAAKDEAKATQTFFAHMVAAYALIVLLAMHVGAALQHYLIKKDGVLRRMLVRAGACLEDVPWLP